MKKNFSLLFIVLYLFTSVLPGFEAVDRIAFHWLYLSVLNALSLVFIIFDSSLNDLFSSFRKVNFFKIFLLFFLVCCLSLFYSINIQESILSISRLFILMISFLSLFYHLKKLDRYPIIFSFLFFLLSYESLLPFLKFLDIINQQGEYNFSLANDLKTFAPNKNITAAIILTHLGLVFYLLKFKNKILNSAVYILTFLSSISLVLLSARATILSIIICFVILLVYHLFKKIKLKLIVLKYFAVIFFGFLTINLYLGQNNSVSLTNRLTTVNVKDESTSQRLRFYKHGLNHLFENPLIGVGIGNWKLKSIEYDKTKIESYVVPYHLHNDFLQYGTETGLIGLFLYLLLFIKLIYSNLINIKTNYFLSISLFISSFAIFIDSNLNFPHHRPAMMILLILLLVITELYNKTKITNE